MQEKIRKERGKKEDAREKEGEIRVKGKGEKKRLFHWDFENAAFSSSVMVNHRGGGEGRKFLYRILNLILRLTMCKRWAVTQVLISSIDIYSDKIYFLFNKIFSWLVRLYSLRFKAQWQKWYE